MTNTAHAALNDKLSNATTEMLTITLANLVGMGQLDMAGRLLKSSIVDELCSRIPTLDAALDAWFMDLDSSFQCSGEVVLAALI